MTRKLIPNVDNTLREAILPDSLLTPGLLDLQVVTSQTAYSWFHVK